MNIIISVVLQQIFPPTLQHRYSVHECCRTFSG